MIHAGKKCLMLFIMMVVMAWPSSASFSSLTRSFLKSSGQATSDVDRKSLLHRYRRQKMSMKSLQKAAKELAIALRKELGSNGAAPSARDRLNEEANLRDSDDALGADLLRTYVRLAPDSVLIFPLQSHFRIADSNDAQDDDADVQQTTDSERTVIRNDGSRMTIRKLCKGGECVQEKSISHKKAFRRSRPQTGTRRKLRAAPVSKAVSEMVDSMKAVQSLFGNDGFQRLMGSAFTMPSSRGDNKGEGDEQSTADNGVGSVTSVQSVTISSPDGNGHTVTRTKRCNGVICSTQVSEKHKADDGTHNPDADIMEIHDPHANLRPTDADIARERTLSTKTV